MGYRFSLESANTVANLTFGKVMSCYRDICSSQENYNNFMTFLEQFSANIYSNDSLRYIKSVDRIKEELRSFRIYKEHLENSKEFSYVQNRFLSALQALSDIFNRCKVKSLLLPPINDYDNLEHKFITSYKTFNKIVNLHNGDSCLILQPEECHHNISIFDAFPNFDVALRQADLWPAVMFWDEEEFAFVPVNSEEELLYLYKIIKYERFPLGEIKRYADRKRKTSHYIFQLSDLHFGAKNVNITERRLKTLIKKQVSSFNVGDRVDFVITGDAVDSPNDYTENHFKDFEDFLREQSGNEPIRVLGNHDINPHGLAVFHGRQKSVNSVAKYPEICILEENKTILLLFNSNTNGNLAEGEIGINQMAEMGTKLDNINNIDQYKLIAVMHHHLLPVPKPRYYQKKWYEKFIPEELMDETLKLKDAELFIEWLNRRNIKYVIHGHKHIPFKAEHKGISVFGCGSSTGVMKHKEKGKTYLSYNLIKISDNSIVCTYYAEDILGAGVKDITVDVV